MSASTLSGWGREQAKPFRTRELFAMACVLIAALAYYNNEVVLTREVFYSLLSGQLDASRIDVQYDLTRKWAVVGYVFAPVLLALQVGLVAFVSQLVLLLLGADVSLKALFRLALIARLPIIVASGARLVWLSSLPSSSITKETLNVIPWSLASLVYGQANAGAPAYALLTSANPAELAWVLLMGHGLTRLASMRLGRALSISFGIWVASEASLFAFRSFFVNG